MVTILLPKKRERERGGGKLRNILNPKEHTDGHQRGAGRGMGETGDGH